MKSRGESPNVFCNHVRHPQLCREILLVGRAAGSRDWIVDQISQTNGVSKKEAKEEEEEEEKAEEEEEEDLERLTRTGPKRLHVHYKYILSKFNA